MFDSRQFLVKERIAFMKLVDTYDIFDLESGAQLGIARENVGPFARLARLVIGKRLLPTTVEVRVSEASPALLTIKRGVGLFHTVVVVQDQTGTQIGRFRSKLWSLGGAFEVFDGQGVRVAEVKGDWKGWNFAFRGAGGEEIGKITKKWAGLGKEMFTSADNYVISLNESTALSRESVALLLAAGLAVDVVFKEK